MKISKVICTSLVLTIVLVVSLAPGFTTPVVAQKQQVTLTAIVAEPKERWDILFNDALQKLREKHPDIDIQVD
jgi:multiple sugar transport system substrate-binding protein